MNGKPTRTVAQVHAPKTQTHKLARTHLIRYCVWYIQFVSMYYVVIVYYTRTHTNTSVTGFTRYGARHGGHGCVLAFGADTHTYWREGCCTVSDSGMVPMPALRQPSSVECVCVPRRGGWAYFEQRTHRHAQTELMRRRSK